MGSFRRPRFMSSPVLSDLARFHASSPSLQLSNASIWNSVQTAVIKVFQEGGLQANELYSLNESIRWLQRTELGSFITEYFQDQLLNKGLAHILEKIQLHEEILPTLQAIFYPVQGQELTVRQMALLGFRDQVLLKLSLENMLHTTSYPPAIVQMLLILQGIHEPSGPSKQYYLLERLVDMVISPYLSNYLYRNSNSECHSENSTLESAPHFGQPEITITHFAAESLTPLVEQEGEAYLERTGGIRRHTVANVQSDIQFLSLTNRTDGGDNGQVSKAKTTASPRPFPNQLVILDSQSTATKSHILQNSAEMS
ncbi:proline-rich protein 5-like isoform X2 [Silurus meridionalis]|uniref:proline-rich protein 5-like isoform X2 n=1 Tax=Silurus meridionalis TaxID=175797 RepID=UPI001EEA3D3E|nr:proline-rich protein 5-like isoform X2 [Silurus meridionalis]